jgi:hypothetical protein
MARLPVLFLIAVSQPLWSWQANQSLQARLAVAPETYTLTTVDSLHALLKLAADYKLPMGIEWRRATGQPVQFSHTWHGATVLRMAQDIAGSIPESEVEVLQGVVHIILVDQHYDVGNPLGIKLPSFEVKNQLVDVAQRNLSQAVNALMFPPRGPHGWAGSIGTSTEDQPINIKMTGATAREILDQMCLADARLKVWIVAYPATATRTPAGYLRTAFITREVPLEDFEQPHFTFLPWGRWIGPYM